MDELLALAVDAHGGLNTWNEFENLRVHASSGGALWDMKQIPGLFSNAEVKLKLQDQHVVTHLPDIGERIVFTPAEMSLESTNGRTLERLANPGVTFAEQSPDSKWDKLHAGYFCSYALWGYLTTPFLYTYPGFEVREVEPWHENGERWRVLEVIFPKEYAAHTRTQYSFFGEDGLLRRHLYTVDVLGGSQGANYAFDYRAVDRLTIPTRRRVLAYDRDRQKVPEPVLVSIDLSEIHFA
jgi:hypothetical protein